MKKIVEVEEVEMVEVAKESPAPVVVEVEPPKPKKMISFEHFASVKSIPKHHHGGMKAFCIDSDRNRSLEEWEEIFKSY